jgi:hypothetical protein
VSWAILVFNLHALCVFQVAPAPIETNSSVQTVAQPSAPATAQPVSQTEPQVCAPATAQPVSQTESQMKKPDVPKPVKRCKTKLLTEPKSAAGNKDQQSPKDLLQNHKDKKSPKVLPLKPKLLQPTISVRRLTPVHLKPDSDAKATGHAVAVEPAGIELMDTGEDNHAAVNSVCEVTYDPLQNNVSTITENKEVKLVS